MGGTAVRGHTLGISVGNPLSVEPSLDVFNNDAYESIDFAILAARVYGIKLLIPLVDNVSLHIFLLHAKFQKSLTRLYSTTGTTVANTNSLTGLGSLSVVRAQISLHPTLAPSSTTTQRS